MKKKPRLLLLVGLGILLTIFLFILKTSFNNHSDKKASFEEIINSQTNSPQADISQRNWYYVGIKENNNIFTHDKLEFLKKKKVSFSEPIKTSYLQWENNSLSRMVVPLLPVATEIIDNTSSAKKIIINSDDYQIRLFQIEGVEDSNLACENVISASPNKEFFPDSSDIQTISKTNRDKSWQFTEMLDETTQQTFNEPQIAHRYCILDGNINIWILEVYLSRKLYEEKYRNIIPEIVNSFAFVH